MRRTSTFLLSGPSSLLTAVSGAAPPHKLTRHTPRHKLFRNVHPLRVEDGGPAVFYHHKQVSKPVSCFQNEECSGSIGVSKTTTFTTGWSINGGISKIVDGGATWSVSISVAASESQTCNLSDNHTIACVWFKQAYVGIMMHEAHKYGICFKRDMYNKGEPFDMYGSVKSNRYGHGFQCYITRLVARRGIIIGWIRRSGGLCGGEDGEFQWSLQTKKHHWWQDRK